MRASVKTRYLPKQAGINLKSKKGAAKWKSLADTEKD